MARFVLKWVLPTTLGISLFISGALFVFSGLPQVDTNGTHVGIGVQLILVGAIALLALACFRGLQRSVK